MRMLVLGATFSRSLSRTDTRDWLSGDDIGGEGERWCKDAEGETGREMFVVSVSISE